LVTFALVEPGTFNSLAYRVRVGYEVGACRAPEPSRLRGRRAEASTDGLACDRQQLRSHCRLRLPRARAQR